MKKFDSILLFSGGIDSFIAWHYLGKPQTVYFDLKTKYSKKEIKVVQSLIPNTIIDDSLDFSKRERGINAYVPFRNLLLAAQAVHYSDTIIIAGIEDDNVSDKNPEAFLQFSNLLTSLENRPIKILSPFWNFSKTEIVNWYLHTNHSITDLMGTISCYSEAEENYCGKCPSCFRKWVSFTLNGIFLPYYNKALLDTYLQKAKNHVYTEKRNKDIQKAIELTT